MDNLRIPCRYFRRTRWNLQQDRDQRSRCDGRDRDPRSDIAVAMGGAAFFFGKWDTLATTSGKALFFIVLAGLFGGLSWLWGFLALQGGGEATAVNAIDRLSIVFILIFAALFLGESFTWQKLFGVSLISLGVVLVTMSREQILTLVRSFIPS